LPGPIQKESIMNAKTILTAAALAAAFVTGVAQAATPHGEIYGYSYRVNDQRSAFVDGARQGKFDSYSEGARISNRDGFSEGAHISNRDGYTDGARISNRDGFTASISNRDGLTASISNRDGLTASISNRDGLTASISNRDGLVGRTADPYLDGARFVAGLDRSGVSANPARKADPYLDGARTTDVYTDGALA
jgi:hypothetical protein